FTIYIPSPFLLILIRHRQLTLHEVLFRCSLRVEVFAVLFFVPACLHKKVLFAASSVSSFFTDRPFLYPNPLCIQKSLRNIVTSCHDTNNLPTQRLSVLFSIYCNQSSSLL